LILKGIVMDADNGNTNQYYALDPYRDFIKTEAIPVVEGFSVDCLSVELEPWERLGGRGAYVHLVGRSDYLSCYVAEIPEGDQLKVEHHLYDEYIYVVQGHGITTIELPHGKRHIFEWGPHSLFSIPLNTQHQHFNGSGSKPVRFAAVTNLAIIANLFHNVDFIFDNPYIFSDRAGDDRSFQGDGEFREVKPGRHQWETNLFNKF
jgi:mannose-6-phosphate isomerase-like protein (cupin superfamily)